MNDTLKSKNRIMDAAFLWAEKREIAPTSAKEAWHSLGLAVAEELTCRQPAASEAGAVADGWKMVPVELTPEMIQAGSTSGGLGLNYHEWMGRLVIAWRKIVEAAPPSAPAAEPLVYAISAGAPSFDDDAPAAEIAEPEAEQFRHSDRDLLRRALDWMMTSKDRPNMLASLIHEALHGQPAYFAAATADGPTRDCSGCAWCGPESDCVYCGSVGPLCPKCNETTELRDTADAQEHKPFGCDKAPVGYLCTRLYGHDGPCAVRPTYEHLKPVMADAQDVDFLTRVLELLPTWTAEDWNELLERNPGILAMLRSLVTSTADAQGDERAAEIVMQILDDLKDRKGVGDELEGIDDDVYQEMVEDLTNITRAALSRQPSAAASAGDGCAPSDVLRSVWNAMQNTADGDDLLSKLEHMRGSIERAALAAAKPEQQGGSDAERLDWLEDEAKRSFTGVSFDYAKHVEDGYVTERGFRFMRRHFLGERKPTIRQAIDAARAQRAEGDPN